MSVLWAKELEAAELVRRAEDPERRRLRTALRDLWDSAEALEASWQASRSFSALVALRREALRLAAIAEPFPALADDGASRTLLANVLERGLDAIAPTEHAHALEALKEAHLRALDVLERPHAVAQRSLRMRQALVVVIVLLVATASTLVGAWVSAGPADLAQGKPFAQSSKWADCHPDLRECGGYPTKILFHTNQEANPWFRIDLEKPTAFSSVTVVNRQDMALPLAVPLILEVSDDGANFKQLARRDEVFDTWTVSFATVTARYVRLRVDRTSTLHLEAVRVYP